VRLSGEDPQLFGDNPFAQRNLLPETHIKAKINTLDVKGDEAPQAKPWLYLVEWVRFASGASSWRKPSHETTNSIPWTYSVILLVTKGIGRKIQTERRCEAKRLQGFRNLFSQIALV
jgi:hypothetical protein